MRFAFVLLALAACGHSQRNPAADAFTPKDLEMRSLQFVKDTHLLGNESDEGATTSSPSSGGFSPSLYPAAVFTPGTTLVLPASVALYLNQTYPGAGFQYQSFDFVRTGCSSSNALERYITAIGTMRGKPLSAEEAESFNGVFDSVLGEGLPAEALCLFYDMIACIADYSVQNQEAFQRAAKTGDFGPLFTGAASCIAEVLGTTVTLDPDASMKIKLSR